MKHSEPAVPDAVTQALDVVAMYAARPDARLTLLLHRLQSVAVGVRYQLRIARLEDRVLSTLAAAAYPGLTASQVAEKTKGQRQELFRALRRLEGQGRARRTGQHWLAVPLPRPGSFSTEPAGGRVA